MNTIFRSFSKLKDTVTMIMVILLVTKFLGFLKTRIFAQLFGASPELDLFWAAFTIPDLLFNVIIAGSLNAAIIPIFSNVLHDKGKNHLNKVFRSVSFVYIVALVLLSLLIIAFANPIAAGIVNNEVLNNILGITKEIDIVKVDMLASLIRIMMISPILLAISNFFTAYMQTNKKFFSTSIAPLFYNLGTIIFSLILVERFNLSVYGISWAVVFGSFLHLVVQIPEFIRLYKENSSQIIKSVSVNIGEVFTVIKLATPRVLGIFGEHINQIYNTMLAFTLSSTSGALSAYRFATNLYLFPVHIVVSSISQVALPDLSESFTKKDNKRFLQQFNAALQQMLYLLLPITAIILILRLPIVRITLGVGAFSWWDTVITSWCLALLSLSIVPQALATIVFRAFFAIQETWLPLIATVITIVVNVILAYYFTNFFSHYFDWRPIMTQVSMQLEYSTNAEIFEVVKSFIYDSIRWSTSRGTSDAAIGGIALAYSVAFTVEAIILSLLLNYRTKIFTMRDTLVPFIVKVINTLLMTASMYFVYKTLDFYLDTSRTIPLLFVLLITLAYGSIMYIFGSYVFRIKETNLVMKKVNTLVNSLLNIVKYMVNQYAQRAKK